MATNGKLPRSELTLIQPGFYLRKDAARAWIAMNEEAVRRFGKKIEVRDAYRDLDGQVFWRRWWCAKGKCGNAAVPGTSNHGLGLSVDLKDWEDRVMLDKIGAKYGFAKKWSDAANEWWHITWKPGVWKPTPSPYRYLTENEAALVRELLGLRAQAKRNGGWNKIASWKLKRASAIKNLLEAQRKRIWRAAQDTGWEKANRRQRYRILKEVGK